MAEEPRRTEPNSEPPKVTLNGHGKPPTSRVTSADQPGASPAGVASKQKMDAAHIKQETTRISLADAQPGAVEPLDQEPIKRTTMRIDLSSSGASIVPSAGNSQIKQTSRIDLSDSVKAEAAPGAEVPHRATSRIELSGAQASAPEPTVAQAKKMTAHIELTSAKPSGTEPTVEAGKKMTARIELPGEAAAAIPSLPPPGQSPMPRTIRIKQPAAPTVALKRSADLAPSGDLGEPRKSETTRIEVPAESIVEQPVTRRKTIRIKRPDAGVEPAPHTVTIAREGEAPAEAAVVEAVAPVAGAEEPGALYTLMIMAAMVIVLVLIYVLAAQTFAPDLPFMGKV